MRYSHRAHRNIINDRIEAISILKDMGRRVFNHD
jgi:hypothetical protein